MKRSPLVRKTPMNRGTCEMPRTSFRISVKAPKRMKAGRVAPNAEERRWMAFVASTGCIVCRNQGYGHVPCAVHHIVEGGRRLGHLFTIGLCDPGHHQNAPSNSGEISRHPNKAQFEQHYGTEYQLLEQTKLLFIGQEKAAA